MSGKVGRPAIDRDEVYNRITNGGVPGYHYVSPIRLSEELGLSARTLRRMLREFEADGSLVLKRREGTKAIVYFVAEK